jgi:hypothetical protein
MPVSLIVQPFTHGFAVAWNGDKVKKSHCQTIEKTEAILAACYPLNYLLTPSIIQGRSSDAKIEISSSKISTCIVMIQGPKDPKHIYFLPILVHTQKKERN